MEAEAMSEMRHPKIEKTQMEENAISAAEVFFISSATAT